MTLSHWEESRHLIIRGLRQVEGVFEPHVGVAPWLKELLLRLQVILGLKRRHIRLLNIEPLFIFVILTWRLVLSRPTRFDLTLRNATPSTVRVPYLRLEGAPSHFLLLLLLDQFRDPIVPLELVAQLPRHELDLPRRTVLRLRLLSLGIGLRLLLC